MGFAVITDLHDDGTLSSARHSANMLNNIQNNSTSIDFVVYTGDILWNHYAYDTVWSSAECNRAAALAVAAVAVINYPYMFTLGNHDAPHLNGCRGHMAHALSTHDLHIGSCRTRTSASCIHPNLPIATLDATVRNCRGDLSSIGCPTKVDVDWVGNHSQGGIIFTHFPPPTALGKVVRGFVNEDTECWSNKSVPLPPHRVHAYGHDHNNMYARGNVVALFKSGTLSYGPDFTDGPGVTVFDNLFHVKFYHGDSGQWIGEHSLLLTTVGSSCKQLSRHSDVWVGVVIGFVVLVVVTIVVVIRKRRPRSRETYENSDDDILLNYAHTFSN